MFPRLHGGDNVSFLRFGLTAWRPVTRAKHLDLPHLDITLPLTPRLISGAAVFEKSRADKVYCQYGVV